ncbi:hypothetical protein FQA39_LY12293 [Lamprigera yunnana]|nr:hypothetical protein FQA39_LY12293 [Lamprigera yunnana]
MATKNEVNQWGWRDLEELLQCPICLDIPAVGRGITVEQCIHGHHICFNCRSKSVMLVNNTVTEKKSLKKKKKKKVLSHEGSSEIARRVLRHAVYTPDLNKGRYPCRAKGCDVSLPASRLLNHVRSNHSNLLTEGRIDENGTYTQTWEVTYTKTRYITELTYIVFVNGIGLIYINIEILRGGQVLAVVRTCMKLNQAQNYLAMLEFFSERERHSHFMKLVSLRNPIQHMLEAKSCFFLSRNRVIQLLDNKKFSCKLKLARYNRLDSPELTELPQKESLFLAKRRLSLINEQDGVRLSEDAPELKTLTVKWKPRGCELIYGEPEVGQVTNLTFPTTSTTTKNKKSKNNKKK